MATTVGTFDGKNIPRLVIFACFRIDIEFAINARRKHYTLKPSKNTRGQDLIRKDPDQTHDIISPWNSIQHSSHSRCRIVDLIMDVQFPRDVRRLVGHVTQHTLIPNRNYADFDICSKHGSPSNNTRSIHDASLGNVQRSFLDTWLHRGNANVTDLWDKDLAPPKASCRIF